jgi:hypothetical protein
METGGAMPECPKGCGKSQALPLNDTKTEDSERKEYDNVLDVFRTFYDFGDETRTDVEEALIAQLDTEQERDSFASFLSGYKYARKLFTGFDLGLTIPGENNKK